MTAFRTIVSAAALGAAAMYVLDPDRGRRRRALARDKARRFVNRGSDLVDAARRDAAHRFHALRAKATYFTRQRGAPSDEVLVERVRARLGRAIAHPHAVRVMAAHGRVRLDGPILRREHQALLSAVRSVRGVREVDDSSLALHDRADGVSALQGHRRRNGERAALLQDNWTPALRVGAMAGGSLVALLAQRCDVLSRLALTLGGIALVARGAANVPLGRMLGIEQELDDFDQAVLRSSGSGSDEDWSDLEAANTPRVQIGH
jgi:hypothetical protein